MPFTPAHTAIVLPFLRHRKVSATGMVIGSMAPDFEYFFKMSVDGVHGHTWAGLFYFDLPVTIGLAFLFHLIVKQNLISNLPLSLQQRFTDTLSVDFGYYLRANPLIFIVSALAGASTHIIWDGFTHGSGFFVNYFSFYDATIVEFQGVKYPLWYALQHISTITGLTILSLYIYLKQKHPAHAPANLRYWTILILITLLVVAIRFLIHHSDFNLGNLVVSMISGICIGLICCGLISFPPFHSIHEPSSKG
jgi:hypothetical protein